MIPGFTQIRRSRKAIQREKFLFFDIGVRNGILRVQNNRFTAEQYGPLFEQWIILQILTYRSYHKMNWNLFYYRDEKKVEVDLILETPEKIYAIEIKWKDKYISSWKSPLLAFAEQNPKKPVELMILYRGHRTLKDEGVSITPFTKFLNEIERIR